MSQQQIKYVSLPVTPFAQNCSVLWEASSKEAVLIDPGGDIEIIKGLVESEALNVQAIWLTHGHLDHVGGAKSIAKHYGVEIIGPHQGDEYWLQALPIQAQQFGFPPCEAFVPDRWLVHGDILLLGQVAFEVRHCPGHTPGHIVLIGHDIGVAFVGDVLFHRGIGRSDFPGGNGQDLLNSIRDQLLKLPDETVIVSGHGPNTTIGDERKNNPYLRGIA